MSAPALRPFLPSDTPTLAAIFKAAVDELTGEDYTSDQRGAWACLVDDEVDFAARLAARLTLVATMDGEPVGFAALLGVEAIDFLYVLPSATGNGVATLLCDALERLATARGGVKLTVDASDTAEPFFQKRGYVAQSRNTRVIADEWLANTTMTKQIAAPASETLQ